MDIRDLRNLDADDRACVAVLLIGILAAFVHVALAVG